MCKILFFSTFFFILYFRSISAVKCPSCDDILISINNASLPANKHYCETIVDSTSLCRSELFIDLIDVYTALIKYITASSTELITSNTDSDLLSTIKIPLDVGYPHASVIYDCYDKDLCNNEIVQKQYKELTELNYTKLISELTELLYDSPNVLKQNYITCHNRNNKIEKCFINGGCQATLIVEEGRSDILTTTCIPDRRPGSTAGLTLRSNSIGNDYKKTSISYICNKDNCNDPVLVQKIREIFAKINLISSKANNLNFLSIVLFVICIIINI